MSDEPGNEKWGLVPRDQNLISRGMRYIDRPLVLPSTSKLIQAGNLENIKVILEIGDGTIIKSAASSDASIIAVSTRTGVHIHSGSNGERITSIQIGAEASDLDISHENQMIAVGKENGEVGIWRPNEEYMIPLQAIGIRVDCLKFTPDCKNLIVSYCAGYAYKKPYILALWDLKTSTVEILEHRNKSIREFMFSPDGRYLIESTGLENYLWDIYSRKFIRKVREHSALDFMPYFSDDGQLLGTMGTPVGKVSKTNTGEVVDTWSLIDEEYKVPDWIRRRYELYVREREAIAKLKQYSPEITALAFLGEEKIVSGGNDAVVRIWDVKSGSLINTIQLEDDDRWIYSISVSSDNKYIAIGFLSGDVPVISVDRGVVITELKGHHSGFSKPGEPSVPNKISVAFSSDSQLLSTAGSDGVVKMWKCNNWNLLWATELGSRSFVNDITFSRNSKYLGIGHESGPVTILDVDNGQVIKKHHGKVGFGVQFINNDTYLVSDLETWLCVYSMTNDNKASIELTSRDLSSSLSSLLDNDIPVGRLSISTDERLVFLPAKELLCVDLVNHNQTRLHSNHSGSVRCSAISSDGRFLTTGGCDGVIRIWAIE